MLNEQSGGQQARHHHQLVQVAGQPRASLAQERALGLRAALDEAGAVLLRGGTLAHAQDLERVVRLFAPVLNEQNGEHTPTDHSPHVYQPVVYAPEQKLLWHNENSFDRHWPTLISFYCEQAAQSGGETVLVDSRAMLEHLSAPLVDEFRRRGVAYVRTMGLGIGRHWREVFRTDRQQDVERFCRANGFEYRWLEGDVLQTRCARQATVFHPRTGQESWFNQAQHWHQRCLDGPLRDELLGMFGADAMPRDCTFGDGEPIPDEAIDEVLAAYAALEWAVPWRHADLLLVDNVLVAHGRNPFVGERKLLVVMGGEASSQ